MYASGTVSLTEVKKNPMGEMMPMAFCSIGKSCVDILEV